MTPSTITIEGVEYDLVPKSENKKDWEIVEFDYLSNGTTCRYKRHSKEDYYWQGASMFPFAWFKSENITIHSVKRLIDGETFKVGDEIEDGKIKSIVIRPINPESIVEQCWIECFEQCGTDLMYAEKVPPRKVEREPLFTTSDGKDIFLDGEFWWVGKETFLIGWSKAQKLTCYAKGYFDSYITFSTEENAKNYINLHKPVLSVWDIHTALIQLSQVNERDINKYDYNEQLKKIVFKIAQSIMTKQ